MNARRTILSFAVALLCFFALPANSFAAAPSAGLFAQTSADLGCDGKGHFLGELFPVSIVNQGCSSDVAIFGNIICNFVSIMNQVLGTVYCGMQAFMLPILAATLTLYVAVFGIQILIGGVQATHGEIVLRLLKIGAVWMFASQSAWGIGILYKFFVGFALTGIQWTMSSLWAGTDMAATTDMTSVNGLFGIIDSKIYKAISDHIFAHDTELLTFFLGLSLLCPPVFLLAASWMWYTIKILVRTMLSFMMGISAIAFLIALSPLFLSFMLFKTTVHFFETWLKYLISYSLQIVIVFACIAMWMSVTLHFTDFFVELSTALVAFPKDKDTGAVVIPENSRGLCPIKFGDDPSNLTISCITGFNPKTDNSIAPTELVGNEELIYYLAYHLLALMIIAYAFSKLLEDSQNIATALAGPADVAPLGGRPGGFAGIQQGFTSLGTNRFTQSLSGADNSEGGGGGSGGGGILKQIFSSITSRKPVAPMPPSTPPGTS